MLGILDAELFPNDCEVIEMSLHNQYVYMIQKNGTTSLRLEHLRYGNTIFVNEQVRDLDYVDVYIRNAQSRYVSGVSTYLQHLQRDHPHLDSATAFWFAKRYNFLNRHYLPQFHWLYNLSRFMNPKSKIRIRDFKQFADIASFKGKDAVLPPTQEFVSQLLEDNNNIKFWWYVDQILLDLAGQELTWNEIIDHYRQHHPDIATNVLPAT